MATRYPCFLLISSMKCVGPCFPTRGSRLPRRLQSISCGTVAVFLLAIIFIENFITYFSPLIYLSGELALPNIQPRILKLVAQTQVQTPSH